jgi:hypothetical protein
LEVLVQRKYVYSLYVCTLDLDIDYYGIKCEVVKNYKDAIDRLTSRYNNKYCEYYACIIMSGEPYAELPNPNDNPHLFGQFINVIKQFWEN